MSSDRNEYVLKVNRLPAGENASTFDGHEHGASVSFFLSRNLPGSGPDLHRHPYEETFIIEDGNVRFTVGEETVEATAGDIVVVPPGRRTSSSTSAPGGSGRSASTRSPRWTRSGWSRG
jgi:mannose-6-phosphate isomerase-like protein (cupin superfamily)